MKIQEINKLIDELIDEKASKEQIEKAGIIKEKINEYSAQEDEMVKNYDDMKSKYRNAVLNQSFGSKEQDQDNGGKSDDKLFNDAVNKILKGNK